MSKKKLSNKEFMNKATIDWMTAIPKIYENVDLSPLPDKEKEELRRQVAELKQGPDHRAMEKQAIAKLTTDNDMLRICCESAEEQHNALRAENTRLQALIASSDTVRANACKSIERLQAENERQMDHDDGVIARLRAENESLRRGVDTWRAAYVHGLDKLERLQAEAAAMREALTSYRDSLSITTFKPMMITRAKIMVDEALTATAGAAMLRVIEAAREHAAWMAAAGMTAMVDALADLDGKK